jgi:YVTN family beta-propeller protein
VSVIDAATTTVTATSPVGSAAGAVAVDPATGTVYVSYSVDDQIGLVSVIDAATNTVTATIRVGSEADGVAVDPAAGTVYVVNPSNAGAVSVIDAATNTVTATIPVGTEPEGVAVDPSTHTAYVTNTFSSTVSVIGSEQAPTITSADSASIGMQSPVDVTVTATGVPVPALSETGALPSGITFTDNGNGTATLSGTAPAGTAGSYPITITAANGIGSPATQAFTLNVTTAPSAPAITSDPAAAATFGQAFSFTITTNGYPLPRISKTGALPPGVYLANNGDGTATIAGTPDRSALGPYTITLTAANKAGRVTQSFTLTVSKAPVIANIPATSATIGTPLDLAITATGYDTPVLTESGTLPSGLSFTSTGNGQAAITGTPARDTTGRHVITITATNQVGTVSQTFILTVRRR